MAKGEHTHQVVDSAYLDSMRGRGSARLYKDYRAAKADCSAANLHRTDLFSFVVFADEQFAVITIPVVSRED